MSLRYEDLGQQFGKYSCMTLKHGHCLENSRKDLMELKQEFYAELDIISGHNLLLEK